MTIAEIIREEVAASEALTALQQRHQEEWNAAEAQLTRLRWLRACHRAGFDVGRITHALELLRIEGCVRQLPDDELDTIIRLLACKGGFKPRQKYVGDEEIVVIIRRVQDRPLDDRERDAAIYFLANVKRLPGREDLDGTPAEPDPATPVYDDPFSDD